MKKGDVIEVIKYRDNNTPTIKIGVIEDIRDVESDTCTLTTYKRNVITRSRYLITLKGKDNTYRSYYDKFLTYQPVSRFRLAWLKIGGLI